MKGIYQNDGQQAVSVVIGMLLLVSILFLAAAQYQLLIVPQQEEATEISHHRLVSGQMEELRTNILSASSNAALRGQKLQMGTEYDGGNIFGILPRVNQPNPAGNLKVSQFNDPIRVRNVEGQGSASNYWPGSGNPCGDPNHCFATNSLQYKATYNRFTDNPEMVYENTILYDYYAEEDTYQFHNEQNMVQGRTINLISLTGDLDQSRVSPVTVETIPISAPAQSITVQGNASGPVEFDIPTHIPAEIWETDILARQMTATNDDGYIERVEQSGAGYVTIVMQADQTYNLKLSRVHLTTRETRGALPVEKAAYIAWRGNDRVSLNEGSTTEITAQVRDRFNNPVSGIKTKAIAEDSSGSCIGDFRDHTGVSECDGNQNQPGRLSSGENGELTYYYETPEVDRDTAITIQLLLDDPDNTVSNDLHTESPSAMTLGRTFGSVSGDFFRMGPITADNTIRIIDLAVDKGSTSFAAPVRVTATLDNTGPSARTITLEPKSPNGVMTATPAAETVTIPAGGRVRYGFDVRFFTTGRSIVLDLNGVDRSLTVHAVGSEAVPVTVRNRYEPERIDKGPSYFKDGDRITESGETRNIPPVDYDTTTGESENTAAGNLYEFRHIGAKDDQYAHLNGDSSGALNIGLSTANVASNEYYTMLFNYHFDSDTDYVLVDVVNATGHTIDPETNYYLPNEGDDTERYYQLSDVEAAYVQQANELYLTIGSPSGTESPRLRIDRASLRSTPHVLNRTAPTIGMTGATATSDSSVITGEPYEITASIENTGTAVEYARVALFEDDGERIARLRAKDVAVNPGETKTVQYTRYVYVPGAYQYSIGIDGFGETDAVTVDVGYRRSVE